jgi:hypothetical protein
MSWARFKLLSRHTELHVGFFSSLPAPKGTSPLYFTIDNGGTANMIGGYDNHDIWLNIPNS